MAISLGGAGVSSAGRNAPGRRTIPCRRALPGAPARRREHPWRPGPWDDEPGQTVPRPPPMRGRIPPDSAEPMSAGHRQTCLFPQMSATCRPRRTTAANGTTTARRWGRATLARTGATPTKRHSGGLPAARRAMPRPPQLNGAGPRTPAGQGPGVGIIGGEPA
jgi:hypothetical protein